MQGDPKVLDHLNRILAVELTAIDQYFIHSRMYQDWGYRKLYERLDHEMADEKQHVDMLIQRILMLEGTPNLTHRAPLQVGENVEAMLANDLALELQGIGMLREAISYAETTAKDFATANLLVKLLRDSEEDHAHWLEQQLHQIQTMGLPTYLQSTL